MTERYLARPETARAPISSAVSGGKCHLQEVLLAQFCLDMYKVAYNPMYSFICD